jgi:DNA-binding NarL/FixJ family response regulator
MAAPLRVSTDVRRDALDLTMALPPGDRFQAHYLPTRRRPSNIDPGGVDTPRLSTTGFQGGPLSLVYDYRQSVLVELIPRPKFGQTAQPGREGQEMSFRCVIADDHPAIVDAVCRFVEQEDEIELVGRAVDGERALRLIADQNPDVAVVDIRMPGVGGVEIARTLNDAGSATAVILYTGYAERGLLLEALDAGARGFLLKEAPLDDLIRAIRTVCTGGTYVDPALAALLAGPEAAARLPTLTKREREVLRLLSDGMRNEQVAVELTISPLTVRTHVKNAMEKLEADTRTQAVARALRESLIT